MGRPSTLRVLLWGERPQCRAERKLLFKLDLVILTYSCVSFWVNYLDRGALSNAYVTGMKEDLHLHGHQFNVVNTCLTVGCPARARDPGRPAPPLVSVHGPPLGPADDDNRRRTDVRASLRDTVLHGSRRGQHILWHAVRDWGLVPARGDGEAHGSLRRERDGGHHVLGRAHGRYQLHAGRAEGVARVEVALDHSRVHDCARWAGGVCRLPRLARDDEGVLAQRERETTRCREVAETAGEERGAQARHGSRKESAAQAGILHPVPVLGHWRRTRGLQHAVLHAAVDEGCGPLHPRTEQHVPSRRHCRRHRRDAPDFGRHRRERETHGVGFCGMCAPDRGVRDAHRAAAEGWGSVRGVLLGGHSIHDPTRVLHVGEQDPPPDRRRGSEGCDAVCDEWRQLSSVRLLGYRPVSRARRGDLVSQRHDRHVCRQRSACPLDRRRVVPREMGGAASPAAEGGASDRNRDPWEGFRSVDYQGVESSVTMIITRMRGWRHSNQEAWDTWPYYQSSEKVLEPSIALRTRICTLGIRACM